MFQAFEGQIFAGTLNIWIYYVIILIFVVFLLGVSKYINILFEKLNKVHITIEHPSFKLTYISITLLIGIIIVSMIIIGYKEFRWISFAHFQIFAGLAFSVMPLSIGLLSVYFYILKNREYRLGNVLLLAISFASFCMVGTNLHDVIWCGVATEGYTVERLAGRDLESFYTFFQIYDTSRWDYRTFGLFMVVQVSIEIMIGTLALYKFYKLSRKSGDDIEKKKILIIYFLVLATSLFFGVVQFIFDYPWAFSDLEYFINVYGGIPCVTLLFVLSGIYLAKRKRS